MLTGISLHSNCFLHFVSNFYLIHECSPTYLLLSMLLLLSQVVHTISLWTTTTNPCPLLHQWNNVVNLQIPSLRLLLCSSVWIHAFTGKCSVKFNAEVITQDLPTSFKLKISILAKIKLPFSFFKNKYSPGEDDSNIGKQLY